MSIPGVTTLHSQAENKRGRESPPRVNTARVCSFVRRDEDTRYELIPTIECRTIRIPVVRPRSPHEAHGALNRPRGPDAAHETLASTCLMWCGRLKLTTIETSTPPKKQRWSGASCHDLV